MEIIASILLLIAVVAYFTGHLGGVNKRIDNYPVFQVDDAKMAGDYKASPTKNKLI
ncbi:MAG: hypothetical protein LUC97_05915 [Clostridiales bacterium]|nr:hypothetical protein [Clostridiales bacterium]